MRQFDRNPTVAVQNVKKHYQIREGREKTIVEAIRGISLVSYEGDSIGVLGRNGSGKSTLLRLISGGESLTSGSILTSSQPVLRGVSAALQPRLTGAQNVRIGCLAMGMTPEEVDGVFDDICKFADIGDAINRPMDTYSSGMGARLRFAISTAANPEILLIDEALSTGDAAFADKANQRMQSLLARSGTVFLVSHGAGVIQEHCNRAIWLHEGRIIADGEAESVTKSYRVWGNRIATGKTREASEIIVKIEGYYKPPQIVLASEIEG